MIKKAKQHESDEDDDVYLEVKQEVFGTANRQKNPAAQETRETPAPKMSASTQLQEVECTPRLAKISKETRAALKIVRKYDSSTPLYNTAVGMISEHVLASKSDQSDTTLRSQAFAFIEKELLQKRTPRGKLTLVVEHVRGKVALTLAHNLARVIESEKDLNTVLLAIRSEFESRHLGSATDCITAWASEISPSGKRKRHSSDPAPSEASPKRKRVDQSVDTENEESRMRSKQGFNLAPFLALRDLQKVIAYARQHFQEGQDIFNFHVRRSNSMGPSDAISTQLLEWSALSDAQKYEWQELLAALHRGSRAPVQKSGQDLLKRHQASLIPATAVRDDSSTSSSDSSGSDDDTSDDGDSRKPAEATPSASQQHNVHSSREATEQLEIPSEPTSSALQRQYVPDSHEAAEQDGYPRNIPWSKAEKRVLLKGINLGWSIQKIASELPSLRPRTPQAISCAKSQMNRRHPKGVPVIRADTPFPLTAAPPPPQPQPMQRTGPEQQSTRRSRKRAATASTSVSPMVRAGTPFPVAVARPSSQPQPIQQSTTEGSGKLVVAVPRSPTKLSCAQDRPTLTTKATGAADATPEPTFLQYEPQPRATADNHDLEYLLLPIGTPECPTSDADPKDVTEACWQAFGKHSAFEKAQELGDRLWVATFRRKGSLPVPKVRLKDATIKFRGHEFHARHLCFKPPKLFDATFLEEEVKTTDLVAAIHAAFGASFRLPRLTVQTWPGTPGLPIKRIFAQFIANPGLVSFYIPVQVAASRHWVHVRFSPSDPKKSCWVCKVPHLNGGCEKANRISYPTAFGAK
ncbi:hypothetical protein CB0940_10880 [Cercospora beticola]|uniref:Uncharacterized protein n=1 Tax=Cercospora beticola TaxID=122368 RepID=A0A2G5HFC8_CERBT|nr:hypothetical protein CB0940_10880 [Cercospora beticola]PIA90942.1 hypothetical protein CB0940_10880 [Cercospora beticola]WPB07782.1 hypothetical protein RHO25_012446 [Cercospora beticola]